MGKVWPGYGELIGCIEHPPTLTPSNEPRMINADKLARRIAGHSNYHGDSILAAIYCAAEGRENAAPIRPVETPQSEPLTLEVFRNPQLCQMVGKTVNVIRMGERRTSERATGFALGDGKTDSGCLCYHELYGRTWIAYRIPTKMEENENGMDKR